MEVSNILKTKVYELSEGEKVPEIKHWLGQGGSAANTNFSGRNREMQNCKKPLQGFVQ